MENPDELRIGDIHEGRVIKLLAKCALISLPRNCVGILSRRQLSWTQQVTHPGQILTLGETIEVLVHKIRRKNRGDIIILGYRELQTNPWDSVESIPPIGSSASGTISVLFSHGVLIALDVGFDGYLHNSEISWTDRHAKASMFFEVGDVVTVAIIGTNKIKRRISLSYREARENPWDSVASLFPIGGRTTGRVVRQVDFGLFIELSNGCIALLHKSQMPLEYHADIGAIINIVVLEIDSTSNRISVAKI